MSYPDLPPMKLPAESSLVKAVQTINKSGETAAIASGYAETGRVKKALNPGVGHFIRKPYTTEDNGTAVEKERKGAQ